MSIGSGFVRESPVEDRRWAERRKPRFGWPMGITAMGSCWRPPRRHASRQGLLPVRERVRPRRPAGADQHRQPRAPTKQLLEQATQRLLLACDPLARNVLPRSIDHLL